MLKLFSVTRKHVVSHTPIRIYFIRPIFNIILDIHGFIFCDYTKINGLPSTLDTNSKRFKLAFKSEKNFINTMI